MSDTQKPLAKSLHTVSVLVNLATYLIDTTYRGKKDSAELAVQSACYILELDGKPDVYGLKGQALKQLNKGK